MPRTRTMLVSLLIASVAVANGAGCATGRNQQQMPTAAAQAPTMSDPEIVATAAAINRGEIQQAELARTEATTPAVQQFAQRMQSMHNTAAEDLMTLAARKNIVPQQNPASQRVTADAQMAAERLRSSTGPSFDQAYVDSQLDMHRQALTMLDNSLIPNARDPDLRAALQSMRDTVYEHLQSAQQLRNSLPTAGPATGGGPRP